MHICRFRHDSASDAQLGVIDSDANTVRPVDADATTLETILEELDWESIRDSVGDERIDIDDATLLSPVERPTNLVGIGLNYAGHAEEGGYPVPEEPLFFAKSPSSINDPRGAVVKHPEVDELHYEGEFGFVVGRTASRVSADEAMNHVFGFTAANDVTARGMQLDDLDAANPWFRSKSMDTFTPLGPWVTPAGEGVNPSNASIRTRLNGDVVQDSSTNDFIFDIPELVSYVSHHVTLHPGDVVLTGTPAGVGEMEPGDTVEVEVEGVGTLTNQVTGP